MDQAQETTIALAVFTIWITFLYIRVFDKTVKKYILSIGVLLIFWMTIKIIRCDSNGLVSDILWYLYYLPLIFIPTLYYECSRQIMNLKSKKNLIIVPTISALLFLLVLTNNIHNLVFKIPVQENKNYTYNIGYYAIYAWIILLLVVALKNLLKYNKEKRTRNLLIISTIILGGVLYTILYNIGVFANSGSNMPLVMGVLFCIALELFFDFDLIPNNYRYKKYFKDSSLPLEIISNDGEKIIKTNYYIETEKSIIDDIKCKKCKEKYKNENRIQSVKKIYGGYAIEEKDLAKIKKLKETLQKTNKELLKQEQVLKAQKKLKEKTYELKIKNEVVETLDNAIFEKKKQINQILGEMQTFDKEKMYYIKLLIDYCKRMSCLIISNYNGEKYNSKRLKLILSELLEDAKALEVNGSVQNSEFELESETTIRVYNAIFETITNIKKTYFVLNITEKEDYIELKYLFDKKITNLKEKIKQELEAKEELLENETILIININKN